MDDENLSNGLKNWTTLLHKTHQIQTPNNDRLHNWTSTQNTFWTLEHFEFEEVRFSLCCQQLSSSEKYFTTVFFRKEFQDSSKLFEASLGFIEFFKAFLSNPVPIKSSFKRDCSKIFPVFKRIFADFKRDCSKFFQDSMGFYKILFQISILTNNR